MREKFVRLQQNSQLLNLDSAGNIWMGSSLSSADVMSQEEDVDEFYNGSGIAWQLGEQEARNIAALRV